MELVAASLIGVSFMFKSPLALLPFVLAAYDLLSGKLKRGETSWKLLLAMLLVPYVLLLPWTAMNAHVFHQFTLFEADRANQNIITGALGITHTVEGAYPLTGLPPGASVMLWAAQMVVAHPLVYVAAVLRRLFLIFTWHPWLFTAFGIAVLRNRRSEKFRILGLFAAYFVVIHAMLSVEYRYMFPLWPALALGAAALFERGKGACGAPGGYGEKWVLFACLSALFFIAYAASVPVLIRYAWRGSDIARILKNPSALERLRGNPWALGKAARYAIVSGDVAAGERLAGAGMLSRPYGPAVFAYAQSRVAQGRSIDYMFRQKVMDDPWVANQDVLMLKSASAFSQKRYSEGREYFYQSVARWRSGSMMFKGEIDTANEAQLYLRQQSMGLVLGLESRVKYFLDLFPSQQREAYRAALAIPATPAEVVELLKASPSARELYASVDALPAADGVGSADILVALARLRMNSQFDLLLECGRKYLSLHEDAQVRLVLIGVLGEIGDMPGMYSQMRALRASSGKQYDGAVAQTVYKLLEKPAYKAQFSQIEQLHRAGKHAALIAPAREYLAVCPVDKVAVLYLATALIITGNYIEAELRLKQAENLPLSRDEAAWKDTLRNNLRREIKQQTRARLAASPAPEGERK
ncbi:MAG: hypothetical protein GX410_10125 [Elusimicrobia bacterium]|nr:hypothetical protein [Elusimicrobiota bacterium]